MDETFFSLNTFLKNYKHPLETSVFSKLSITKKRTILLAICDEAVAKTNPLKLNIKEVAHIAGVSVGALYKYFNNRDSMLTYATELIRTYLIKTAEQSTIELLKLNFKESILYYCEGAKQWSKDEKKLTSFYYQAAYCSKLPELVQPVSLAFKDILESLITKAISSKEITLHVPLNLAATILYQTLLPYIDSMIYPDLAHYFFPGQVKDLDEYRYIEYLIRTIGVINEK